MAECTAKEGAECIVEGEEKGAESVEGEKKGTESVEGEKASSLSRRSSQVSDSISSSGSFERIEKEEVVAALPEDSSLPDYSTLPPLELPGVDVVDNPEDMHDKPLYADQEQYFTQDVARDAIGKLIVFSLAMLTMPIASMYFSYEYVFIGYFHCRTEDAIVYAALTAATLAITIAALFAFLAYQEEKEAEARKEEQTEQASQSKKDQ